MQNTTPGRSLIIKNPSTGIITAIRALSQQICMAKSKICQNRAPAGLSIFKERRETPAKVGGGEGTLAPPLWLRFQIHLSRRPLGHIRTNFTGMTVMSQTFQISRDIHVEIWKIPRGFFKFSKMIPSEAQIHHSKRNFQKFSNFAIISKTNHYYHRNRVETVIGCGHPCTPECPVAL